MCRPVSVDDPFQETKNENTARLFVLNARVNVSPKQLNNSAIVYSSTNLASG